MVVNKPPVPRKIQPAPQWSTRTGGTKGRLGDKYGANNKPSGIGFTRLPLDLNNRDPKGIALQVSFADVFAEPPRAPKSSYYLWSIAFGCYSCWKTVLYKLFTLCTGVCIAIKFGCDMVWITYTHIWICTPSIVCCHKHCHGGIGRAFKECMMCCVGTFTSACGECFWAFGAKGKPNYPNETYLRANERDPSKGGNKVKFNNKVKTKTIPRNPQAAAAGIGGKNPPQRASGGQQPTKKGQTTVKPAGKSK